MIQSQDETPVFQRLPVGASLKWHKLINKLRVKICIAKILSISLCKLATID